MLAQSLHIPIWVRNGITLATEAGVLKRPRTGWDQSTMASFFRLDKRCWLISDSFWFTPAGEMVCQPELLLSAEDPQVIAQCEFLASVLGATYKIMPMHDEDAPAGEGGIAVKFTKVGA